MTSTWLENPDERPTFAVIVQNLSSICNLTETTTVTTAHENTLNDTEDTTEANGYISLTNSLPES